MSHFRAMGVLAVFACLGTAIAQEKTQEEVLQLKGDNKYLFGKIASMNEKGVDFVLRDGSKAFIEFKDMMPSSVYKVKADRVAADDAQGHFDLGEFCLANGMFTSAVVEYDKSAAADKGFADKAKKRKEDVHNEEARAKLEEAKRLGGQKKYAEALEILKVLSERFSDTTYFDEGKKEAAKLAEELKKENEARERALADKIKKKDDAQAKGKEDAEKQVLTTAVDALDEAKVAFNEGLDHEMKPNFTKADKAWKAAEAKLQGAKLTVEKLSKSNDVNMIKQAKELDKDLDAWLLRTYYRLGRMWAAELAYTEAMVWLNKGLKLSPDDPLLNGVQLTLTQMQMRKRAAGGGY